MLTEAALIEQIRRRIFDVEVEGEPMKYADVYYQDAIGRAVEWLNVVFCVDPPLLYVPGSDDGLSEIARPYTYLLLLKATIEMAHVRAAEASRREDSSLPETETVEVPNLTVTKKHIGYVGPQFWMRLAKELLDELNDLVRRLARVQDHAVRRTSPLTDTVVRHALDTPMRVPTVKLEFQEALNAVVVSWPALLDQRFAMAVVERDTTPTMASPVTVAVTHAPHRTMFVDLDVPPGAYWYRVRWTSKSGIVSKSGALPIEV